MKWLDDDFKARELTLEIRKLREELRCCKNRFRAQCILQEIERKERKLETLV